MKAKPRKEPSPRQSAIKLKQIRDAWPDLGPWHRRSLFVRAMWYSLPRLAFPVRFALLASTASFALLLIMPTNPLAIPASFGGGLSLALFVAPVI